MAERAPFSFANPPIQNEITPGRYLTEVWRDWFIELQTRYLFRWDDLRFPAASINPVGGVGAATVDTNSGVLLFSGVADNAAAGVAQMPHGWAKGTTIKPHMHLRFPTSAAANTRWLFEYDIANVNEDFTNALGTYTALATITVANPQNVNRHVIAPFGDLTMAGRRESCVILWRITRLAASDAADTDGNNCALLEFDIHYQIEKEGTVEEYPTR